MAAGAAETAQAEDEGEITFRGMAHPWLCDTMGHLNTRHYAAMFDDASFTFLHIAGGDVEAIAGPRLGWADVRHEIDFLHEVPMGTLVTVRTRLVKLGGKSMTYRHVMRDLPQGEVRATMQVVTVLFDLDARKAVPIEGAMRARAEALLSG